MFGSKKRKEKKEEKRENKAIEDVKKNRSKYEEKVKKKLAKKLDADERIIGIVAYGNAGTYIAKTNKSRFYIGGVQGFSITETILTKDKILNVSKTGLMPPTLYLDLLNSKIRLFQEGDFTKMDYLHKEVVKLIG